LSIKRRKNSSGIPFVILKGGKMTKTNYVWDEKEQKLVKKESNLMEIGVPLIPKAVLDPFVELLDKIKEEILSRYRVKRSD
jgi:hypothetical protein